VSKASIRPKCPTSTPPGSWPLRGEILALAVYVTSPLYSDAERVVLEYAESMTITGRP